ncbi:hypothetical protein BDZ97DRAFT_2020851, partial [Flammula alnicola]
PVSGAPVVRDFLETLQHLIRSLPDTVAEASDYDDLAIFEGNPEDFDDPSLNADELWETVLNQCLKSALGWGTEGDMDTIIRRGRKGLDGLMNFIRYFVIKRGVSEALFEGKLSHLMKELEKRSLDRRPIPVSEHGAEAIFQLSEPPTSSLAPEPNPTTCDEVEAIDVDAFEYEDTVKGAKRSAPACNGYALVFPGQKTPYSHYPFALHDTLVLPWEVKTKNGTMSVVSTSCTGFSTNDKSCQPCQQLSRNGTLEGILKRLEEGVHGNSSLPWYGFNELHEKIRQKNRQIEFYRLRGLNQAKKLLGKAAALSEQKRLLMAISSGDVHRVDRVISIGLRQKKGARGLLASVMAAAQGFYRPKSFTEEEDMRAILIWRLSGNRVAEINHRSQHAPSVSYLRSRSTIPPIVPSPGKPTKEEVRKNVESILQSVLEVIHGRLGLAKFLHVVLMFDELATEKRIRWDQLTNFFLGICRQHAHKTSLEFINEDDMVELFRAIDDGEVHCAAEATVAALGILSRDHRIYPGRPVLISGDCKRETGEEHAEIIQTVLSAVNSTQEKTKLRVVSLASDGETRRGSAFILHTFKRQLSMESPLYVYLACLVFLNLHVGDDDLTCDKDWKHVFKRFRNLLLRLRGVVINGFRITPDILRDHFRSCGLSADHIRSLFNPDDQQDVKMAFDMLKDIWTLPRISTSSNPGFLAATEALWILGKFLYHMVFPYLCVDLSLSEQIEHLSAAAHLAMALYSQEGKDFIPTNLYIDLMIMIKNAIFCTAKAKVDNPDGEMFIILLGTDRLEELFGILRTMVGNDANLDILQLASRLAGTTEISNILAKYPHWDRAPRRLKLPVLSRESKELHDRSDHIKPASWRGNVKLKDLSLQTSWKRGRQLVEKDCSFIIPILHKLENTPNVDMLSPLGVLLFDVPLAEDDIDESLEFPAPESSTNTPSNATMSTTATETRIEVEDALGELAAGDAIAADAPQTRVLVESKVLIGSSFISKSRALSRFSKYRVTASSTDRLRRVQAVERYVQNKATSAHEPRASSPPAMDEAQMLVISDPVTTVLSSESKLWLCIGEVNSLKIDGQSVDYVGFDMLAERTVSVSYQMLGLRPAITDDDPELKHDWRTYRMPERSFTVPGALIGPVNPTLSSSHTDVPWYLFESSVLVALAASLTQELTVSQLKSIPKFGPTRDFPYLEASGRACFLCDDSAELAESAISHCPKCSPTVDLDLSQGQRVLEHIGAHILFDSTISQSWPVCGLCLRPSPLCQFFLKKGKGAHATLKIDDRSSKGCLMKVKYSYRVAAESSPSSPCSNVPIQCPICPKEEPAIWRYFFKAHFRDKHGAQLASKYAHLWTLSNFELDQMQKIWIKRRNKMVKRTKKKHLPLVISEDHRAQIPGRYLNRNTLLSSDYLPALTAVSSRPRYQKLQVATVTRMRA